MKKAELYFSLLLLPLDYAMIILAGLSAYLLRYSEVATEVRPAILELPLSEYLKAVAVVGVIWLVIFSLAGLYSIRNARKLVKEMYRVVLACSTGFALIVVIIFIQRDLFDSRFIILAGWVLAMFYIIIARSLVRWLQRVMYGRGVGVRKVVVVGDSKTSENLIQKFAQDRNFGYEVVKRIRDFSMETSNELKDLLTNKEVDEIIQADPNLSKGEVLRLYDFADEHHITFKYVADLLGTKVLKNELMEVAGVPVVEVKRTPLEGWGRIVKRTMDVCGSLFLILILSPMLATVAVLIKLDSKGPVFFAYKDDGEPLYRVGQGGRLFHYFKFRSMIPGSDNMRYSELAGKNLRNDGPLVKIEQDPRVTRVGRFIRRWSIDEFPELFLVFKGEMSLVGPRPHLPEEVAKYARHHKKALTVKPGMTGLAQISGRSDLSFEEEVRLDTYYIENWSVLLDISILIRTPLAVIKARKAE